MQRRAAISLHQLLLIGFCYVFLEWLFFATKPSFLSLLPFGEQPQILFVATLPLLVYGLALHLPLLLADLVLRRRVPRWRLPLPAIVPAAFATALVLVQLDNFTYVVFGFGIVHASGFVRLLYLAGAGATGLFLIYYLSREQATLAGKRHRLRAAAALAVASIAAGLALLRASAPAPAGLAAGVEAAGRGGARRPNILLFAADGVDADHLPAYGYDRRTTPYLDALVDDALLVENAVANSAVTSGSLTSMLTGKMPTTTKLIYGPPHVLTAADSYQHLPGILKGLGYRSIQETLREWGDSVDLNMKRGFDAVNGKTVKSGELLGLPPSVAQRFAWEQLFHDKVVGRLSARVRHLLGVERMEDTFGRLKPVAIGVVWGTDDATRVARALEAMQASDGPFFVHLHLIGTHCCSFRPEIRKFSAGSNKDAIESREEYLDPENRRNFYDDAILSADAQLGRVLTWLEDSGRLEDTVVVYSSDHGSGKNVHQRVPLLFRFPRGEHRGRIRQTAQLLDVAPTLLDYMGLEIPAWMEGASLLRPEGLSELRPIFGSSPRMPDHLQEGWRRDADWGPPFYGLDALGLTLCHRWYRMDLRTGEGTRGEIPNHTAPCPDDAFPPEPEVTALIAGHLADRGIR